MNNSHSSEKVDLIPTKRSWDHMKQRCLNENNHAFQRYGGRGITVEPSWVESFDNFLKDMGVRPSLKHSLERIDSNKSYTKENCRWATSVEQNNNKDNTLSIVHTFKYSPTYSLSDLSKPDNIPELKEIFDSIKSVYPIARIDGSIRMIANNDTHASFCILTSCNMMGLKEGDEVNYLTLMHPVEIKPKNCVFWQWKCRCGNLTKVEIEYVKSGNTKSCGCLHKKLITTHGMKNTPIYRVWDYLKQKCCNKKSQVYSSFGGKGFSICPKWINSFEIFYSDMGDIPEKGFVLKLKEGTKVFNKENCFWGKR